MPILHDAGSAPITVGTALLQRITEHPIGLSTPAHETCTLRLRIAGSEHIFYNAILQPDPTLPPWAIRLPDGTIHDANPAGP